MRLASRLIQVLINLSPAKNLRLKVVIGNGIRPNQAEHRISNFEQSEGRKKSRNGLYTNQRAGFVGFTGSGQRFISSAEMDWVRVCSVNTTTRWRCHHYREKKTPCFLEKDSVYSVISTWCTIQRKFQCSPYLRRLIRFGCIRRGTIGTRQGRRRACRRRLCIVWFLRQFLKVLHRRFAYLAGDGEVMPSLRWPRHARARLGVAAPLCIVLRALRGRRAPGLSPPHSWRQRGVLA